MLRWALGESLYLRGFLLLIFSLLAIFSICDFLYLRSPRFVRLIAFSSGSLQVSIYSNTRSSETHFGQRIFLRSASALQGYRQEYLSEYLHTNRIVIETEFAIFLIINGHARSTGRSRWWRPAHLLPDSRSCLDRRRRTVEPRGRILSNSAGTCRGGSDSLHWSANNLELF